MPFTRTHLALYNESETDPSRMSPATTASGTNVKHFFACDESSASDLLLEAVTGDTVDCIDVANSNGSLDLVGSKVALVGGSGWTHPSGNDFMWGTVFTYSTASSTLLVIKGDQAIAASMTIDVTSGVPSVKITHDAETTEIIATAAYSFINGNKYLISAVRDGSDLQCVVIGIKTGDTAVTATVVATTAIDGTFDTAWQAAAFTDVFTPSWVISGSSQDIWGHFDYQLVSLQSDYLTELTTAYANLSSNDKRLPIDWLFE